MALKRIQRELQEINDKNESYYSVSPTDDDMFRWTGFLIGPDNSPYEGGVFFIEIIFPADYPFKPPKFRFETRIYHCNINAFGGMSSFYTCCSKHQLRWHPSLTIAKLMAELVDLLRNPNTDHPSGISGPEIAFLCQHNRQSHDSIGKEWTEKYAT